MQNQIRLLQPNPRQYKAEMVLNNQIKLSTVNFANKVNCIRGLNEQIRRYEVENGLSLPRLPANGETVYFELTGKRAEIVHIKKSNPPKTDNAQAPTPEKTKRPHRKPFTPYGLTGISWINTATSASI